jgi:hypothetical protein
MKMRNSTDSDLVEVIVDGDIKANDYHDVAEQVLAAMKKYGRIRVLKEVRNFSGLNFEVFKDRLIFALLKHLKDVRCAAVVSDEEWVQKLTNFLAPAYPYPVRCFKLAEIEEARKWLKSID